MKNIISAYIDDDFNGCSELTTLDSPNDKIGMWHGALCDEDIGKSIRNRLYASFKDGKPVYAVKPSRNIVHELANYEFNGNVGVFEPDSLDRVEKLLRTGTADEILGYSGPTALFNFRTGECFWGNSDSKQGGLQIWRIRNGEIYALLGYVKLYGETRQGKERLTAAYVPSPLSTIYSYQAIDGEKSTGNVEPWSFPDATKDGSITTWASGVVFKIDVSKVGEAFSSTARGSYRLTLHEQLNSVYPGTKGIAIYAKVSDLNTIDSLNDGPFVVDNTPDRWSRGTQRKFKQVLNDPATFITSDGDTTSTNAYDVDTDLPAGVTKGSLKKVSVKENKFSIGPLIAAAALGAASFAVDKADQKKSDSMSPNDGGDQNAKDMNDLVAQWRKFS